MYLLSLATLLPIHPIFQLIVAISLATGINICPIPIPTEAGPSRVHITQLGPDSFLGVERHPLAMAANLMFLAAMPPLQNNESENAKRSSDKQ